MKITITLFGALREADPSGRLQLDVPEGCRISALREHLIAHLATHVPTVSAALVRRSAFGTDDAILHDADAVPTDGQLVVLPPVGGG